ncbi:MAG: hypothetical protein RIS35_3415 [Pseudomonadota bacterium]
MPAPLPTLFVPHGAPTFALRPGAAGAALARMAANLSEPRAIVVVSPHWETSEVTVGFAERPATIHDFRGFPAPLYEIGYPAQGDPVFAEEIAFLLESSGLGRIGRDPGRGLDHGAWIPLRIMFPDAGIPVIPVSVPSRAGAADAWRLGIALAPLAHDRVLVIGSGNLTHNLRDWYQVQAAGGAVPAYVDGFPEWIAQRAAAGDVDALVDYRSQAPDAVRAHPTDEHLLPFHVALGAAGEGARAERFFRGVESAVIAMDAYAFHPR